MSGVDVARVRPSLHGHGAFAGVDPLDHNVGVLPPEQHSLHRVEHRLTARQHAGKRVLILFGGSIDLGKSLGRAAVGRDLEDTVLLAEHDRVGSCPVDAARTTPQFDDLDR